MSAYWIWTIPADVADEKVKEWTTIQQFEGYEYNHDYDEDQRYTVKYGHRWLTE